MFCFSTLFGVDVGCLVGWLVVSTVNRHRTDTDGQTKCLKTENSLSINYILIGVHVFQIGQPIRRTECIAGTKFFFYF